MQSKHTHNGGHFKFTKHTSMAQLQQKTAWQMQHQSKGTGAASHRAALPPLRPALPSPDAGPGEGRLTPRSALPRRAALVPVMGMAGLLPSAGGAAAGEAAAADDGVPVRRRRLSSW